MRSILAALSFIAIIASAINAQAQAQPKGNTEANTNDAKVATAEEGVEQTRPNRATAPLKAVVRGFFIGTRFSMGYMVLRQKIDDVQNWPVLTQQKKDEGYGLGTMLQLEVGYDITPLIAIEVLGGASLINGTRKDRVRDLGVMFGGLGLRVAPRINDRFRAVVAAGAGYANADNAVDEAETGAVAFINGGIEYYVHVRHFSIGIDVTILCPVQPMRLFVGLGPQVKYTF
ncbi:MAG: adventurous gliding motility protein CglE [Deltaproteobacteria bacterium]|nr:adventurous gliding motility protein CglE [Deltaproteobacteria bacterium]